MGPLAGQEQQVCRNVRLACETARTTVDFAYKDDTWREAALSIAGQSINAVFLTLGALLELGEVDFVTGLLIDEVLVHESRKPNGEYETRVTFPHATLVGVDDESDEVEY